MQSQFTISFLGRSGCGKGTQAELLLKDLGDGLYISSGELLRHLAEQKTEVGIKVKEILNSGMLAPEQVVTPLWLNEIAYKLDNGRPLVIDGFPRKINEAHQLDDILRFIERLDDFKIILVDVSPEEALHRLKLRARPDDLDEAIKKRLSFYDEEVVQVVDHYRQLGKIIEINGEQTVENVYKDIRSALNI